MFPDTNEKQSTIDYRSKRRLARDLAARLGLSSAELRELGFDAPLRIDECIDELESMLNDAFPMFDDELAANNHPDDDLRSTVLP